MLAAHKDIFIAISEHLPDIRAFACTCVRVAEALHDHDDFKYWRGGKSREQFLTMKIYRHFECANVMELIKYDRADFYRLHTSDWDNTHEHRLAIIEHDARAVFDEHVRAFGQFDLRSYVFGVKTAEQYRFLKSRLITDGMSTVIFPLVCANRAAILAEIAADSYQFRRSIPITAMKQSRPDVIVEFVRRELVDPRTIFADALGEGAWGIVDALITSGYIYPIPEDRLRSLIPELSPVSFRALADAGEPLSDHVGEITAAYCEKSARLLPEVLRCGYKIDRDHAAEFIKSAAVHGDIESVLLLRRYLGI